MRSVVAFLFLVACGSNGVAMDAGSESCVPHDGGVGTSPTCGQANTDESIECSANACGDWTCTCTSNSGTSTCTPSGDARCGAGNCCGFAF